MRCVDWDITKKVKFENPPPSSETGNPRKVIWITRRQKCSDFPDQLRLKEEEEDNCDCKLIEDSEESLENHKETETEQTEIEQIREHFMRFMKRMIL